MTAGVDRALHHVSVGLRGGITAHTLDGWRVETSTNARRDPYGYLSAARAQDAAIVAWWPGMGADDTHIVRCVVRGPMPATPATGEADEPGPDGWGCFQRAPFPAWLAIQEALGAVVQPGRFAQAMAAARNLPAVRATITRLRK